MDFQANPFSALSLIVAPAVLTNACSVLALGTGNRLARVVDRSRVITDWLKENRDGAAATAPIGESTAVVEPAECEMYLSELNTSQQRALMLIRALRLFYAGLGSFACCALLSVLGAASPGNLPPLLVTLIEASAVLIGTNGVFSIVRGTFLLVQETTSAVKVLEEQIVYAESFYRGAR